MHAAVPYLDVAGGLTILEHVGRKNSVALTTADDEDEVELRFCQTAVSLHQHLSLRTLQHSSLDVLVDADVVCGDVRHPDAAVRADLPEQ